MEKVNRIISAVFLFFALGCATGVPQKEPKNIIDFMAQQSRNHSQVAEGTAVSAYHYLGGGILYSQCKWLPSDSEYFKDLSQSCGSAKAIYMAVGRFLEEPDLDAQSPEPIVYYQNRLRWIRVAGVCSP